MRNVVGTDMSNIDKLTIEGEELIILPGYVRQKYGDIKFSEMSQIRINEADQISSTVSLITDYVIEIGDSKGLKLEVLPNLMGDVTVRKLGFSFQKKLKHVLTTLKEDPEETVYIESTTNTASNQTAIYNLSKLMKMKVVAELDEDGLWCIEMAVDTSGRPKSTKRMQGTFDTVRAWLDSIDYNTPVTPPETFTRDIADSYLRTMFNKCSYDILYRKGKVTKCRALVKQHKNQWQVLVNSKPMVTMDNYDTSLINLTLMPYGLTLDDTVIIGKKFNTLEHL